MTNPDPEPVPARRWWQRSWPWKRFLAVLIIVPILLFSLYTFFVLTWAYSEGERSGVLYKLSSKGWLCKTWEGEINITPTAAGPTIWNFTVRDEQIARQINQAMGKNVVLHYSEHLGIPSSCFGETKYFVDGIRIAE